MKKYKYVHLLWQGNAHFNKIVVDLISDTDNGFNVDEHLFVTPYKHIYNEINTCANVIFEQEIKPQSAELVNKYADKADWIFLHGMTGISEALKIKSKNRRKIIWRTWGHDVDGYQYKTGDFLKNAVKRFLNWRWRREVRSFKLVGGSNIVDQISIRNKFGNIKAVSINYPTKNNLKTLENAKNKTKAERKNIKVLVGHSGIDTDNHFEVIDRIKKFCGEEVSFIFVLSYGDDKYIDKVKEYIVENCSQCSELLLSPLSKEDYTNILADVDIAILDGKKSYALSNVAMLVYLEKKIFLNRDGILAQAFNKEGVPFCYTDEIDQMTFEEFSKKIDYSNVKETSLAPIPYEKAVERWKKILDALNTMKRKQK